MAGISVSWHELDAVWPWARVLKAREALAVRRYHEAYPTAALQATFIAVNAKPTAVTPMPEDLLLPGALPLPLLQKRAAQAERRGIYSARIVDAFTLARALGFTGNAHLAAFGTRELRASGWEAGTA